MNEQINSTQTGPQTDNPQDAAPSGGASNAEDFQTTAPSDTLSNEQPESLSVEQTGVPIEGTAAVVSDSSFVVIVLVVVFTVAIGGYLLAKLLRESIDDNKSTSSESATATKPSTGSKSANKSKAKAKAKSSSQKPKKSYKSTKNKKKR